MLQFRSDKLLCRFVAIQLRRGISSSKQLCGGHGVNVWGERHIKPGEKIVIDIDDPSIPPIPDPPFYANYHKFPTHPELGDNPGPPITMDYIAVPVLKYAEEYPRLQRKFNMYLLFNASLLVGMIFFSIYVDAWSYYAWKPLDSFENRHKYAAMQEEKKKQAAIEGATVKATAAKSAEKPAKKSAPPPAEEIAAEAPEAVEGKNN